MHHRTTLEQPQNMNQDMSSENLMLVQSLVGSLVDSVVDEEVQDDGMLADFFVEDLVGFLVDEDVQESNKEEDKTCGICYEPYTNRTTILQCKHTTYYTCIKTWIDQARCTGRRAQCPFCRGAILLLVKEREPGEPGEEEILGADDFIDYDSDSSEDEEEVDEDHDEVQSAIFSDDGDEEIWELRREFRGTLPDQPQNRDLFQQIADLLYAPEPGDREAMIEQLSALNVFTQGLEAAETNVRDYHIFSNMNIPSAKLDEYVRNVRALGASALEFAPQKFFELGNMFGYAVMREYIPQLQYVYRQTLDVCRRNGRLDVDLESFDEAGVWAELRAQWAGRAPM
jgi:hypothetical protein